jgi:ketopantoate reductase
MKICVYGAGAIGGHIAARLALGGAEVSLVARGAHLAAIQANGLTVHAHDGTHHSRPKASQDPRELGPQDAVIVTVKTPRAARRRRRHRAAARPGHAGGLRDERHPLVVLRPRGRPA